MKKLSMVIFIIAIAVIAASRFRPATKATTAAADYIGESPRLTELLGDQGIEAYASAVAPREFSFPRDHGAHPEFRNEWWYVTGNLDGKADERYGFELTIFRFSLTPVRHDDANGSAWRSNQVYIGHFAVTDVGNAEFHVAQRLSRAALGLAGAQGAPFRVWLEDWTIEADGGQWRLYAEEDDVKINLTLHPLKPPVLNGIDGLSRKSAEPRNASYYYSVPRLETLGKLTIDGREFPVSGLAWLDREWGTSGLARNQQGWDWYSIQLSDGSELMFYNLRQDDGSRDAHSAGTWVTPAGESRYLDSGDVLIEVEEYWDSPLGGTYPMGWRLRVPKERLDIRLMPVLEAQELQTMVRYWEGAVDVVGERSGRRIDGRGYVELTGYAHADPG